MLDALAARRIELLFAVRPHAIGDAAHVIAGCRERGVAIGLWPMLSDADGRWPSTVNAEAFESFVREMFASLPRDLRPDTLAIDLEPPIRDVRAVLAGDVGVALGALRLRRPPGGVAALARVARDARERGIEVLAAVVPPLGGARGSGFERALSSPLASLRADAIAPLAYTSLFEGYARGVLRRDDARALLSGIALCTARANGSRAALCLGAVGVGALGDERVYRAPSELRDDVAIARASGVDDLALFDLGGVLARPPVDEWLAALTDTAPSRTLPRATLRTRALFALVELAGAALSASRT